jgi:hypothetical protein
VQIAQLAEEAAEAVHLLDALGPAEQAARVDLVVASVTKVIRKAERYTGGGHGGRALEALVAIAEEIVRPEELPGAGTISFPLLPSFPPGGDMRGPKRDCQARLLTYQVSCKLLGSHVHGA